MIVVSSYDTNNDYEEIPKMEGLKFGSFDDALDVLKPGQAMTLKLANSMYKSVGIDEDGERWIQKRAVTEY